MLMHFKAGISGRDCQITERIMVHIEETFGQANAILRLGSWGCFPTKIDTYLFHKGMVQ